MPRPSADWKFTPGRRATVASGLLPARALSNSAWVRLCTERSWPRPTETVTRSSSERSPPVEVVASVLAVSAGSTAGVDVADWAAAGTAWARLRARTRAVGIGCFIGRVR